MEYNIKLIVYFEVKDSPVFGGQGSVGYTHTDIDIGKTCYETETIFNNGRLMNDFIESQVSGIAGFCEIPKENVRTISKKEYEENTEGDEGDE